MSQRMPTPATGMLPSNANLVHSTSNEVTCVDDNVCTDRSQRVQARITPNCTHTGLASAPIW